MYGFSYQGMTQLLAAAAQPEGLALHRAGHDRPRPLSRLVLQQGALRLASSLGWGLQMLKADARRLRSARPATRSNALGQTFTLNLHTPYRDASRNQGGRPAQLCHDWFDHANPANTGRDGHQPVVEQIKVPALHLSGWYDTYLQGQHRRLSRDVEPRRFAAGPRQSISSGRPMGPHSMGRPFGAQNFGSEANFDTDNLHLRWFNHWLKDSGEFSSEPRIRYFALNENQWYTADKWPATNHTLYLHSEGRANSSKGDGVLATTPPNESEPSDVFVVDPEVAVLAPGGITAASGCHNQATLELSNNLLTYTTSAFTDRFISSALPRSPFVHYLCTLRRFCRQTHLPSP